jgi:hypothetical protein
MYRNTDASNPQPPLRRKFICFPHLSGTLTRGFGLSVGQRPTTAPKAYIMCLKTA